jgi:hypothetical protein
MLVKESKRIMLVKEVVEEVEVEEVESSIGHIYDQNIRYR